MIQAWTHVSQHEAMDEYNMEGNVFICKEGDFPLLDSNRDMLKIHGFFNQQEGFSWAETVFQARKSLRTNLEFWIQDDEGIKMTGEIPGRGRVAQYRS